MNDDEVRIPLPNGGYLVCGPGEDHDFGGSLTITDAEGNEILHWIANEWEEEPEGVIGAVFGAARKTLQELKEGRILEDGAWVWRRR